MCQHWEAEGWPKAGVHVPWGKALLGTEAHSGREITGSCSVCPGGRLLWLWAGCGEV